MLAGLARWLRAAGHDCALAEAGDRDGEILARCEAEGRVLVTRDRRLAERAGRGAVLLGDDDADAQAVALALRLDLDWTFAPFTRCTVDNMLLSPASEADLERIPERSREPPGPFNVCPACGRVYWPGSHVRRMSARLGRWRDLAAARH